MKITKEEFEKNSHISDEQIKFDISVTRNEIKGILKLLNEIKKKDPGFASAISKATDMIEHREKFISLLNQTLEYRKNKLEELQ